MKPTRNHKKAPQGKKGKKKRKKKLKSRISCSRSHLGTSLNSTVFFFFFLSQLRYSVLSPQSSVLSPQSSVLSPQSSVLSPQSSVLSPQSSVLSPQSSVLSPQSSVLSPQSSVLSPQSSVLPISHRPLHFCVEIDGAIPTDFVACALGCTHLGGMCGRTLSEVHHRREEKYVCRCGVSGVWKKRGGKKTSATIGRKLLSNVVYADLHKNPPILRAADNKLFYKKKN